MQGGTRRAKEGAKSTNGDIVRVWDASSSRSSWRGCCGGCDWRTEQLVVCLVKGQACRTTAYWFVCVVSPRCRAFGIEGSIILLVSSHDDPPTPAHDTLVFNATREWPMSNEYKLPNVCFRICTRWCSCLDLVSAARSFFPGLPPHLACFPSLCIG